MDQDEWSNEQATDASRSKVEYGTKGQGWNGWKKAKVTGQTGGHNEQRIQNEKKKKIWIFF